MIEFMSKESESIIDAWNQGQQDKRFGKPRLNPFSKSKKSKYKAYNNGYNQAIFNAEKKLNNLTRS